MPGPAAAAAGGSDAFAEQLVSVESSRARARSRLDSRERLAALLVGGAFLLVASALPVVLHSERSPGFLTTAGFVALYALVSKLEYEIDRGWIVPTQLIFVPMLFVFPLGQVPLLVALALIAGTLVDLWLGRVHGERVTFRLIDSWYSVGPVVVLSLAGEAMPSPGRLPLYLAAILAQFAVEFLAFSVRDAIAFGINLGTELRDGIHSAVIDGGLASVGIAFAFPVAEQPLMILLAVPPIVLLRMFTRERRERIDTALQLGDTYRRTAVLLGDVIEADDAYTGEHSRDVVGLSVEVANALALSEWHVRRIELVALLHDVGKIRVPAEIINKAGPLTDEERAVIAQHTIYGQEMLSRVGGALGDVGLLVRSCHERWDGGGYPDGLAAEEIPIEARIVAACDAFSAMTTDRPYRAAMTHDEAILELRANAGTQFDPSVVTALAATLAGREACAAV